MREVSRLQPEEVTVDLSHDIVAFEALAFIQRGISKTKRTVSLRVQAADLLSDTGLAPIGQFTVVFVPARQYPYVRMGGKVRVKKENYRRR